VAAYPLNALVTISVDRRNCQLPVDSVNVCVFRRLDLDLVGWNIQPTRRGQVAVCALGKYTAELSECLDQNVLG
jgi:hypothetical protein